MAITTKYKMSSADYPDNTFVRLNCEGNTDIKPFQLQLPLPSQITYQTAFDWSAAEVPLVAQTIIDSGKNAGVIKDSLKNKDYEGAYNAIADNVSKIGEQIGASLAKIALNSISKTFTNGTGAAQYFLRQNGNLAYNPNKQLFFNGIDHRPLTISFDIVAQNKEQAEACAAGIRNIRIAASPKYSESHAFFEYPSYFNMQIVVNGSTILEYFKFAITSISTNLSPNGVMSWHSDGKPVAYVLEITGIEAELAAQETEKNRHFLGSRGA